MLANVLLNEPLQGLRAFAAEAGSPLAFRRPPEERAFALVLFGFRLLVENEQEVPFLDDGALTAEGVHADALFDGFGNLPIVRNDHVGLVG